MCCDLVDDFVNVQGDWVVGVQLLVIVVEVEWQDEVDVVDLVIWYSGVVVFQDVMVVCFKFLFSCC